MVEALRLGVVIMVLMENHISELYCDLWVSDFSHTPSFLYRYVGERDSISNSLFQHRFPIGAFPAAWVVS